MSNRLEELAMRRRMLLIRSERLRAELAADQQLMLEALSGVDKAFSVAKKAVKPVLLVAAGALLLKLIRRGHPAARAARAGGGLMMRALFWVSMAQRALPYIQFARNLWRLRSRPQNPYADAGAETEHLH